jgi:hypothetical protein
MIVEGKWKNMAIAALAVASLNSVAIRAQNDFVAAVVSTHPLAYYRLDAYAGTSLVGTTTYKTVGGSAIAAPGAPVQNGVGKFTKLDGVSGNIVTTQAGGIGAAGSIMVWVNLAVLPSQMGHIDYIAGESQNGNDFDIQFEGDNALKFYTASGSHITYAPPPATLVNQWHMILVTLDTLTQTRAIYWDGELVAADKGGGEAGKSNLFTLGASTVFGGRFFKGGVEEAALWNRALKASEVSAIYAAARPNAASAGAYASTSGGNAYASGTGPFATKAKVEVEDGNGPVNLRREEQIAYMFLSAIENIEHNCQLTLQRVCPLDQFLSGSYPSGTHIEHLKFDPNQSDPNYTYTLAASGMAWEAHANPKKAGLLSFGFWSRSIGTTVATYSANGSAGWIDNELMSRGIEGDSFATQ